MPWTAPFSHAPMIVVSRTGISMVPDISMDDDHGLQSATDSGSGKRGGELEVLRLGMVAVAVDGGGGGVGFDRVLSSQLLIFFFLLNWELGNESLQGFGFIFSYLDYDHNLYQKIKVAG